MLLLTTEISNWISYIVVMSSKETDIAIENAKKLASNAFSSSVYKTKNGWYAVVVNVEITQKRNNSKKSRTKNRVD